MASLSAASSYRHPREMTVSGCGRSGHRDRSPTFGYEPTREAALPAFAAFAKSWRRG
jgi:hypothetical protein